MILTANAYFGMSWQEYRETVIVPSLAIYGLQNIGIAEGAITAEVNHGRWIVKCECGGAEKMWEEGIFMCQSCRNSNHKHQYRNAVFPSRRIQIENLLLKRPIANRNWRPGETLAQLRQENNEHEEELL